MSIFLIDQIRKRIRLMNEKDGNIGFDYDDKGEKDKYKYDICPQLS